MASRKDLLGKGLQAAFGNRARLSNQPTRSLHLFPHVPQQYTAHQIGLSVKHHAFTKRLLPVRKRFMVRIHFSYCFITQLKQVRIEKWEMVVGELIAGHIASRCLTHGVGVILVFNPDPLPQGRIEKLGHITSCEYVGCTRL